MRQLPVGLLLTGLLSSSRADLAELWGTSGTGSETGISEFTGEHGKNNVSSCGERHFSCS
jgi:hypothetical protein